MNKEMVKIAEKVKFWEEQDRINKAIIPRLLKNHELITELSGRFSEYTDEILKLEHQCSELSKEVFLLRRNNKILSIFVFIAVAVSMVSLLLR